MCVCVCVVNVLLGYILVCDGKSWTKKKTNKNTHKYTGYVHFPSHSEAIRKCERSGLAAYKNQLGGARIKHKDKQSVAMMCTQPITSRHLNCT